MQNVPLVGDLLEIEFDQRLPINDDIAVKKWLDKCAQQQHALPRYRG